MLFHLRGQHDGFFLAIHGHGGQVFNFLLRLLALRRPMRSLFFDLNQTGFGTLTAFHHKANLRLQTPHFGTGFVQGALRLVHLVAGRIVGLAHGF